MSSLRERLMTAAATELVPATRRPGSPCRRAGPPANAGSPPPSVASPIVGATTSMAVAAQSALPGDALYPLKRAIENAQTGFSVDEREKGTHMLANATGRLDEISDAHPRGRGQGRRRRSPRP